MNELKGAKIVGYTVISNNLRATQYSNNKTLMINLGTENIITEGYEIPAESYLIVNDRGE